MAMMMNNTMPFRKLLSFEGNVVWLEDPFISMWVPIDIKVSSDQASFPPIVCFQIKPSSHHDDDGGLCFEIGEILDKQRLNVVDEQAKNDMFYYTIYYRYGQNVRKSFVFSTIFHLILLPLDVKSCFLLTVKSVHF